MPHRDTKRPQKSRKGQNFGSEEPGRDIVDKCVGRVAENFESFGAGSFF